MSRKDQKTSRPTASDALTLDELDTVVGGAAAAPLQNNATDPLLNALTGGTSGGSNATPRWIMSLRSPPQPQARS